MPTLEDYESWIGTIAMFDCMIDGYPYEYGLAVDSDFDRLSVLISSFSSSSNAVNHGIPTYIYKLFRNIINGIKTININMDWMNIEQWRSYDQYGYLKFFDIFFNLKGIIRLKLFIQIFKNINKFVIFNNQNVERGYEESIELSDDFMLELYGFIDFVNDNLWIKETFKNLIIINPKVLNTNLESFINHNKDVFTKKYQWKMETKSYYDPKRNSKSDKCLYLFPILV